MNLFKQIETGVARQPRRILLYGVHGIGVSTFAAGLPSPVFVPADGGVRHLDVPRFPVVQRFATLMQALHELYVQPHTYRTVVLDPLEAVKQLVWEATGRESGVEHLEQLPFDRGFTLALSHWRQLMERLELLRADIGLHVVLVAHAKAERATIERAGGSAWLIERHAPALLHRQASALIQDWCDEVLFAAPAAPLDLAANASGMSGDGRILHTVPSTTHAAKEPAASAAAAANSTASRSRAI